MKLSSMSEKFKNLAAEQVVGLSFVLVLHALALYGLWNHWLRPLSLEGSTLFVNFIAPPAPEAKEEPRRPLPRAVEKPQSRQVVAQVPMIMPTDYLAPQPPSPDKAMPDAVVLPPPMPLPVGPLTISSELSVACPERSAPIYPAQSRQFGESGQVVLRVELNESGHVAQARVERSSGYHRLDEAALSAVRTWRCMPATQNGQPVRAVALQPFNFILRGS